MSAMSRIRPDKGPRLQRRRTVAVQVQRGEGGPAAEAVQRGVAEARRFEERGEERELRCVYFALAGRRFGRHGRAGWHVRCEVGAIVKSS